MHSGLFHFQDSLGVQEGSSVGVPGGRGEATDGDARDSARPASGLPCLSSNNCDTPPAKLEGYQKKIAESVSRNIERLVAHCGLNSGVLTLTAAENETAKEFNKRVHNFWRRQGSKLFGHFVRVLEFQGSGRPHHHYAIDCLGDIYTGFNWAYYEEVRNWNEDVMYWKKRGSKGPKPEKPRGKLTGNQFLQDKWKELRLALERCGLGRHELVPVKEPAAVGRYLGGYMRKSLPNRGPEHKGLRFVAYSQGFDRAVYSRFSWVGMHSWLWRQKLRCWATAHGCQDLEEIKSVFGDKWAYHHREAILRQEIDHFPTRAHWDAAGAGPLPGNITDEDFPLTFTTPRTLTKSPHEARREYEMETAFQAFAALMGENYGSKKPHEDRDRAGASIGRDPRQDRRDSPDSLGSERGRPGDVPDQGASQGAADSFEQASSGSSVQQLSLKECDDEGVNFQGNRNDRCDAGEDLEGAVDSSFVHAQRPFLQKERESIQNAHESSSDQGLSLKLETLSEANQEARAGLRLPQRTHDQGEGGGLPSTTAQMHRTPQLPSPPPCGRVYVIRKQERHTQPTLFQGRIRQEMRKAIGLEEPF